MTEQVTFNGIPVVWNGDGSEPTLVQRMEATWRALTSREAEVYASQQEAYYINANNELVRAYRRAAYRRITNWRGRKFNYYAKAAR